MARPATTELYALEIEQMYHDGENAMAAEVDKLDVFSVESVTRWFATACENTLEISLSESNHNLLSFEVDSLKVVSLTATIKRRLTEIPGVPTEHLSSAIVYQNPTLDRLAKAVHTLVHQKTYPVEEHESEWDVRVKNLVTQCLARHDFQRPSDFDTAFINAPITVMLIGSTGFLGSFILERLIYDSTVSHVVCINRQGEDRQRYVNKNRGISGSFLTRRCVSSRATCRNRISVLVRIRIR